MTTSRIRGLFFSIILLCAFVSGTQAFAISETGVSIEYINESDIADKSVTLSGGYTFPDWGLKMPYGIVVKYGTDPDSLDNTTENILTESVTPPFAGTREFSTTIVGLTKGTLYFYKLYDQNPEVAGSYTDALLSFTTTGTVKAADGKPEVGDTDAADNVVGLDAGDIANTGQDGSNCTEEGNDEYCFLAPLPGFPSSGKIDGSFKFGDYLNTLIELVIGICAVLAVLMIVVGGVQYMMSDSFSEKDMGKSRITNALIGLVIALGAYTVLNTISPSLVKFGVEVKQVGFEADEIDFSDPPQILADETYNVPTNQQELNGQIYKTGWTWPNDAPDIRTYLESYGIDVTASKGTDADCDKVGESGCTTVKFDNTISNDILNKIKTIKDKCNCTLVVTGGSEFWLHKTHGPGARVVDIRVDPNITKYITGSTTVFPPEPGSCKWYPLPAADFGGKGCALAEYEACGAAPHWHVNFDRDPANSCK